MSEHESMSCGRTPLPLELWGLIIGCLSRTDQRSCLSVSTSLRALARPVVISCITIHFGIWMAPRFYSDLEMQLIKRQKIINSEILRYIACDPQLARAIKTFSVHAHNLDELAWQWSASDLVSVFGNIITALESIPHLRSFQWYGSNPMIPSSMLDALAKTSCGSTLTELIICSLLDHARDKAASRYFAHFKNLQRLSLVDDSRLPFDTAGEITQLVIKAHVPHVSHSLRYLSLQRDSIYGIPLRVLPGLHELSLKNPENAQELSVILGHCSQLRTLNICNHIPGIGEDLLAALEASQDALPHLTSFKLLCSDEILYVNSVRPLTAFFKNKPMMRRLDLRFDDRLDTFASFFSIFASLPQLEVVGLVLDGMMFNSEHLRLLDELLPLHLSALLLTWAFDSFRTNTIAERDWIAMLKRRPSLGYIHVLNRWGTLDLRDALLRDRPRALELVGYGDHLCRIEHDPATGESFYGTPWTMEAVGFGTAEDFGSEDWEWLVRYHIWDGLVRFWQC